MSNAGPSITPPPVPAQPPPAAPQGVALPEPLPFLDVNTLIEASYPQPQIAWGRYGTALLLLVVIGSAFITGRGGEDAGIIQLFASLLMVGLLVGMTLLTRYVVRGQRAEQQQLEAIEELVQLRNWPAAALMLQGLLSRPTRTPWGRIQALIFLSGVLSRYHRFDDAIAVQNYLLETVNMDGSTLHALRLGRAMAMLHEDHLVDADQAINELRKQAFRAVEIAEREEPADLDSDADSLPAKPASATFAPTLDVGFKPMLTGSSRPARQHESAGLALVEMYRDVKTGHPAEAEATFRSKLPILRQQLGHRVADAYVLMARAHDLMGQTELAAAMYQKATLLAPVAELERRYPEVSKLAGRYAPTIAPPL